MAVSATEQKFLVKYRNEHQTTFISEWHKLEQMETKVGATLRKSEDLTHESPLYVSNKSSARDHLVKENEAAMSESKTKLLKVKLNRIKPDCRDLMA